MYWAATKDLTETTTTTAKQIWIYLNLEEKLSVIMQNRKNKGGILFYKDVLSSIQVTLKSFYFIRAKINPFGVATWLLPVKKQTNSWIGLYKVNLTPSMGKLMKYVSCFSFISEHLLQYLSFTFTQMSFRPTTVLHPHLVNLLVSGMCYIYTRL